MAKTRWISCMTQQLLSEQNYVGQRVSWRQKSSICAYPKRDCCKCQTLIFQFDCFAKPLCLWVFSADLTCGGHTLFPRPRRWSRLYLCAFWEALLRSDCRPSWCSSSFSASGCSKTCCQFSLFAEIVFHGWWSSLLCRQKCFHYFSCREWPALIRIEMDWWCPALSLLSLLHSACVSLVLTTFALPPCSALTGFLGRCGSLLGGAAWSRWIASVLFESSSCSFPYPTRQRCLWASWTASESWAHHRCGHPARTPERRSVKILARGASSGSKAPGAWPGRTSSGRLSSLCPSLFIVSPLPSVDDTLAFCWKMFFSADS